MDECTDFNGIGLKVVYKLRNKLAHGDFNFPEPKDWSSEIPLESQITKMSTRVILLSVQMLMLAENRGNYEDLFFYDSEVLDIEKLGDDGLYNELQFLRTFHAFTRKKSERQLELEFA